MVFIAAASCDRAAPRPATRPASQPTQPPTSAPATTRAAIKMDSLLDVVRANDPLYPTTQPSADLFELTAAARIHLNEPCFLDSRGDLWITRADASTTPDLLARASKDQTHVTRERVAFVFWRFDAGAWSPELVARAGDGDVWVTPTARLALDRSVTRDWSRAAAWITDKSQAAVVPTATGVSVVTIADGKVIERHVPLLDAASPGSSTQFIFETRGLLAWSIDPAGVTKVARFVDDRWNMLTPDAAWPERIVQVVPFLDGTVLAIGQEKGSLNFRSVTLESIPVDEARVSELVKALASRDPHVRETSQASLAQIGSGAWPLLQQLAPAQPPEARIRIRAVLGNQTTPTLSGISPVAGPARVVGRLPDRGVVLRFDAGASAVNANGVVQTFAPAWISVRPDDGAKRLPETLSAELASPTVRLSAWHDEWIVEHDVDGPKRWMGNHTEPLLKQSEATQFKRFGGIDAMGRWIFRTDDPDGPTLLIDPTLPDPAPRLPVWTIEGSGSVVGWNAEDWPVRRRGGAWVLRDGAWQPMQGYVDSLIRTSLAERSSPQSTTQTSTQSSTKPTTESVIEPLLIDGDGNRYFDGLDQLIVEHAGERRTWPLPPEATGPGVLNGQAILIEADGKLFLFNAGGKLARLTRQLDQLEPFKLDAVFTRNIPTTDIRRFWKDPAGRLVFASGGDKLSIAFPSGRISNNMSNMIPAQALRDALANEDAPEP